jgi:hypothetical protein
VNLECVDLSRVEDLSLIAGVDGMNLKEMSLEELLYFALVERPSARSLRGVVSGVGVL